MSYLYYMPGPYKTWKKLHRWPGMIIAFFLMYFALSGIILNHRTLFSSIDIDRSFLPENYHYKNWNNAAIKGSVVIGTDSILIYGNIGIWLTDSSCLNYRVFNAGFQKGIDNSKIYDIYRASDHHLYAAAFSGLYTYNKNKTQWQKVETGNETRFTGITGNGDSIYAISRSFLFKGKSDGISTHLVKTELPAPEGYSKKVSLFQTIWQIHSGEIFGIPGKIYVDVMGLVTLFLSVTGIIWFFFSQWIKRRMKRNRKVRKISDIGTWSLKWHNTTGAWTFVLLIIVFATGIFLRPPLLLAIARANVTPLKYSHLDQPNPWYDKLRDILYDPSNRIFMLSTSDGIYIMDLPTNSMQKCEVQPPVSIMGINVLEKYDANSYLIGSFSGIFQWNPQLGSMDLFTGKPYSGSPSGRPVGDVKVTGSVIDMHGKLYLATYDQGIVPFNHNAVFPGMPQNIITTSGISLWSVCLEIHTGRIFQPLTGDFYILIVPLVGLAGIIIVISGYIVWRRKFNKKI